MRAIWKKPVRQLFDSQVQHLRDHAMADRNYSEYGKLLDRNLAWEEKKKYVQKSFAKGYEQMRDISVNGQTKKPKKPKKDKAEKSKKSKDGKERVRKPKSERKPKQEKAKEV